MQFTAFDVAYLERLRAGDARTERHFVDYFSDLIGLKLRSRLSSREAVDDVKQETFARVLTLVRSADGIRQPERLGALVNSICNHVLMEHYRSKRHNESNVDDAPDEALVAQDLSSAERLEVDQAEQVVRKILGELPERDRRILQSVLLDGRDKDQVCAEMGLSREHLRVLVHRAKQTFKDVYIKRWGEKNSW